MGDWMIETFGEGGARAAQFIFALIFVLVLIAAGAYLLRRFAAARFGSPTGRSRQPRLAIMDAAPIDTRRRLVLIRRDNIEHLLLIGGPSDVVVEQNIMRGLPATVPQPRVASGRRHGADADETAEDFAAEAPAPAPVPAPRHAPEPAPAAPRATVEHVPHRPAPKAAEPQVRPQAHPPLPATDFELDLGDEPAQSGGLRADAAHRLDDALRQHADLGAPAMATPRPAPAPAAPVAAAPRPQPPQPPAQRPQMPPPVRPQAAAAHPAPHAQPAPHAAPAREPMARPMAQSPAPHQPAREPLSGEARPAASRFLRPAERPVGGPSAANGGPGISRSSLLGASRATPTLNPPAPAAAEPAARLPSRQRRKSALSSRRLPSSPPTEASAPEIPELQIDMPEMHAAEPVAEAPEAPIETDVADAAPDAVPERLR
ncbi:MAG: flagellar biosynthetic protein FliO [Hyphomicrobiales bacterium]